MIVVSDHAGDIALFGDEAVAGGTERDAPGRAAILYGDERNTREPEPMLFGSLGAWLGVAAVFWCGAATVGAGSRLAWGLRRG